MIDWDHDAGGEAEFWPSGDCPGFVVVFKNCNAVSCTQLLDLDRTLQELGDDSLENYLKIHYAVNIHGCELATLSESGIDDLNLSIYTGSLFYDLRKDAAYELFELYWPDAYKLWESCGCDGLILDIDVFLNSPSWSVEEVEIGSHKAIIIAPQ